MVANKLGKLAWGFGPSGSIPLPSSNKGNDASGWRKNPDKILKLSSILRLPTILSGCSETAERLV